MAAEELKLSDDIDGELNPHVVILANDSVRFQTFKAHLEKNSYPTQILNSAEDPMLQSPRAGTVVFVSFNLKAANAIGVTKRLEQQLGLNCVVFAEAEGVDTAAKLSSAKMTQTLQFPYTEKNFTMAVQTLVKKRKAQHEKNLRKQNFMERQKQKGEAQNNRIETGGVFVQKSAPQIETGGTRVFEGAAPTASGAILEKGAKSRRFSQIQQLDGGKGFVGVLKSAASGARRMVQGEAAQRHVPPALARGEDESRSETLLDPPAPALSQVASGDAIAHESAPAETPQVTTRELISPSTADAAQALESRVATLWAILTISLMGIAICLYCLYEMIWGHRF
ncbi:MAG TPA: hypothetical protein PKC28_12470 [Bdellovibrionales bacterium]|nr:hypothetical protein [Bdellovibrionales bacterium]